MRNSVIYGKGRFNPSYPGSRSRRGLAELDVAYLVGFQSELSRKQVKKHHCRRGSQNQGLVSIRVIPEAGQEGGGRAAAPVPPWCFNPSYPGSRSRRVFSNLFIGCHPWFQSELSRKQVKKLLFLPPYASPHPGFNPSYPGSRSRSCRHTASWCCPRGFQSELSRKQVKKRWSGGSRTPRSGVSIRVIPEAGQEVSALLIVMGRFRGFNPSYPGSRSRSRTRHFGQPQGVGFQSELSRKQVKKTLFITYFDEHFDVSIRVIPEAGQEGVTQASTIQPTCGFNPSYPGSRSRSIKTGNDINHDVVFQPELSRKHVKKGHGHRSQRPSDGVSIRVIPEAGQEGGIRS